MVPVPTVRRVAAIDLGTNTTLMLVAEAGPSGGLVALEDHAVITRLGRGVDRTRRLDETAVSRTLDVLRGYTQIAARYGAEVVAVGTSALRDAENRDAFLVPAQEILGCHVQAIGGDREAALTFLGAVEGIEVGKAPITVVDIGGGSTEIVIGADGEIAERVSLDMGSVRLHERHGVTAPATADQIAAVRRDVRALLRGSTLEPVPRVLAIAGTATTFAAMVGEVEPYDARRVHGMRLAAAELHRQLDHLARCTLEERRRIRGLHPDRADVILTGGLILDEVLSWAGAAELVVSDGGVRYGLAREALGVQPPD